MLAGMTPSRLARSHAREPDHRGAHVDDLEGYAERPPFIAVEGILRAFADGRRPRIVDARGGDAARAGRIPGAVTLPARELHPVVSGVRRLAPPDRLVARFTERGVGRNAVIVYGGNGGADAAHLWWTLHHLGHEAAYLLDGGIESWVAAGHPVEGGAGPDPTPPAQPLAARPRADRAIDFEELKARLGDDRLGILDARTAQECGSAPGSQGAHIPGATLFTWSDALDEATRLRDRDAIARDLAPLLEADEVVTYCQSGVRAAHAYALLRWLDHPRPRLCLGSWAEWSGDPGATGNEAAAGAHQP